MKKIEKSTDTIINETLSDFADWWNDLNPEDENDYDHTVYISEETIYRFLEQQNEES